MATDLTRQYSGIFLNQNQIATGSYDWRSLGGPWVYQTFTFPSDYARGTNANELRIPDLSGFQVLVSIDFGYALSASLDYVVQYSTGDTDTWVTAANGTVIGAHADGTQVWFDVILPDSIPITQDQLSLTWRMGVQTRTASLTTFKQPVDSNDGAGTFTIGSETYTANLIDGVPYPILVQGVPAFLLLADLSVSYTIQQGISVLWYTQPNPLVHLATGQGQAYRADGTTPLLGLGTSASVDFRGLALVADSGTDMLGNEYRSYVTQANVGNTSTTDGLNPVTGTGQGDYWLSPPQPSRFAVLSQYFDVRPVSDTPLYGLINEVSNPSFEYDGIGQAPHWWLAFNSGTPTVVDQTVQTTWSFDRANSLHMKYTFTASNQSHGVVSPLIPVTSSSGGLPVPISVSMQYNLVAQTNAGLSIALLFYDSSQTLLPAPYGTQSFNTVTLGQHAVTGSTVVPASATFMKVLLSSTVTSTTGSMEAYVDAIQVTFTPTVMPYFDGDDFGSQWTGQRGQSPSVQRLDPTTSDNFAVIDGLLLDPITPNMSFSVYYSQDDALTSDQMSESDWEQKLWTHVPRSYTAIQRQQYSFPEPIHAKYVKVEFSNLQPQTFDPGAFQKPVQYKKFPTWVANYFVDQLEAPSFVASQIAVTFDALSFVYQYFLDDLESAPDTPVAVPVDALAQLTSYFDNAPSGVDPITLAKINLVLKQFNTLTGTLVDASSALGSFVDAMTISSNPPPSVAEGGILPTLDYTTVSSTKRDAIVMDQSLPTMYFYPTCRHGYKELTATFSHNRGYFAGVSDIALLRNDYTVASDTALYIETAGDTINVERNDFVLDTDSNWYVY